MTTTKTLTEREQQALEQMREAPEQGSTLKEYAAKIGVDILPCGTSWPCGAFCRRLSRQRVEGLETYNGKRPAEPAN